MNYFKRQITEIGQTKNLYIYGFILAISHLLTAYFFYQPTYSVQQVVCWQFFDNCLPWTSRLFTILPKLIIFYGVLSVICAVLFLRQKIAAAFVVLSMLSILKLLIQLSDYRFMGNYHYMSNIINLAFLFLPQKINILRALLVLFYLAAGIIKFNPDWLSGQALLSPTFLKGQWLILGCAYVILLELVISLLLLSNVQKYFYFALVQIVIFHLFSWHIVGFFYPVMMFCLISLFFLNQQKFQFPNSATNIVVIALFVTAQLIPFLLDPNSSLTNRYRVYALNMLDAYTNCETRLVIKKSGTIIEYSPDFTGWAVRLHCDPLIVLKKVRQTCAQFSSQKDFLDIDFDHQVRRRSDSSQTEQMTFTNVCSQPLKIGFISGALYQTR